MDARHRDKVAFIRVCSGRFEKGMKVRVARTGAPLPCPKCSSNQLPSMRHMLRKCPPAPWTSQFM